MKDLQVLKYKSERILTTKQLAEVYGTYENNITNNFNNNKEHFEEGLHYYLLKGKELQSFKNYINDIDLVDKHTPTLYLWTERGANHHCKILDTKEAWKQFNVLEETYFMVKDYIRISEEQRLQLAIFNADTKEDMLLASSELDKFRKDQLNKRDSVIKVQGPKVDFYNIVANSTNTFSMAEAAKIINVKGIGRNILINFLKHKKILRKNGEPYQLYVDRGYFKLVERFYRADGKAIVTHKTVVFQKGIDYILKLLKNNN